MNESTPSPLAARRRGEELDFGTFCRRRIHTELHRYDWVRSPALRWAVTVAGKWANRTSSV